ncbi:hypothetical protein ECC02_001238 [Trypanosoma cruzi]|uniref:Uncharacterized protein n=1 Tax=Trypanosoma cruzi TaxID=5693 RepID=A0A7J6YFQ3_TRYCR|nr:hypothetical protein ECC02_001238 [Trypanosoma cruzi]
MPLFNIVSKKLKPSEYVVQKVEEGKAMRTVLPFLSRKLGIPSMKNYLAFACDEKRKPVARLDMDIPLEEQGVPPLSFIYVSPMDATPKGPDGEELPLALDLKTSRQKSEEEEGMPPPPPPPEEEGDACTKRRAEQEEEGRRRAEQEEEARRRAEQEEEARRRAEQEEEARRRAEQEEEARRRAEQEEEARRRAEQEEEARRRAEQEEMARRRAEQEEEARRRAEQEEMARRRAEQEEMARRRVEQEEEARRRAEQEEEARRPLVYVPSGGAGESSMRLFNNVLENGVCQLDNTQSVGIEHRVQLNLVPDVIRVAAEEERVLDVGCDVPEETALQLAAVANDRPVHHAVILRLAKLVLSKRPGKPHIFLWSHLQSKLGGHEVNAHIQKKEVCRRTPSTTLTFAPVGDTAEERLVSGAPAGPARTAMRYWAKLLIESKPDNPELFMWSKLEARMERDSLGIPQSRTSNTASARDSTRISLLRGIPRGTPAYTVMRNLVDLTFEKKPDQPEMWMLYHFIARHKSSAAPSGRSSVTPVRFLEEDLGGDGSRTPSSKDVFFSADASMPRPVAMLSGQWADRAAPWSTQKNSMRARTREVSTQTFHDSQGTALANSTRVAVVPRARMGSPLQATSFLRNLSPRELLQPPPCDMSFLRRRRYGAMASDLEEYPVSPFYHEKYSLLSDPLQHASGPLLRRGRSSRGFRRPSQEGERNLVGCWGHSDERSDGNRAEQNEFTSLPPCEKFLLHSPVSLRRLSSSESPESQYAMRRRETDRAEILYEYNWLLQREALRKEQLRKELELLRYEREVRERMMCLGPTAQMALTADSVARSQLEAEARLQDLNCRGSLQFPSEPDAIRKKLKFLDVEGDRLRQLSLARNRFTAPSEREPIGDAALRDTYDSPALHRANDRVGISPHFNPTI